MPDTPDHTDNRDHALGESRRTAPPGMPRWVTISAILALIAVVVLIVMLVAGADRHGPGRHAPGDSSQQKTGAQIADLEEAQLPAGDGAAGHTPPVGRHR